MPPVILDARSIFRWHCAAIFGLAFAHWLVRLVAPPVPILDEEYVAMLVDLNAEGTPASFFAGMALVCCGLVALHLRRHHPVPEGRAFWTVLGGLLLFLGLDEAAQIHEGFVVFGKFLVSGHGIFHFTWWAGYLPFASLVVMTLVPGLLRAPAALRDRLLLGGVLFLAGAVGMEMRQGWLEDQLPLPNVDLRALRLRIGWSVLIEETLEMSGVALVLRSLLEHAAHVAPLVSFEVVVAPDALQAPVVGAMLDSPGGLASSIRSGNEPTPAVAISPNEYQR